MQILDYDCQRLRPRSAQQPFDQGCEQAPALLLGWKR
jgi:hypothetical protein